MEPEPEPTEEEDEAAEAAAELEKRVGALKRQLKKVELLRSMQMDGEELDVRLSIDFHCYDCFTTVL